MLYKKSSGIALPLCLLSLTSVITLGMYCWKELSLTSDLITERDHYYQHFYQADTLLTTALQEIMLSFQNIQQAILATKKPYQLSVKTADHMQAHATIYSMEQQESLRVVLSLAKEKNNVITLSCALVRLPTTTNKGSYEYLVRYFTIGNTG